MKFYKTFTVICKLSNGEVADGISNRTRDIQMWTSEPRCQNQLTINRKKNE